MLEFSPEVRKAYPKDPTILAEVEKLYAEARKHLLAELKAADVSLVAKIPYKTQVLLQVALRRALELAASTVHELNRNAFVPPFVTTRALLETGCVMYYAWTRVKSVLASGSPAGLGTLDDDVMQLLLGKRAEGWGGPIQAKNILTIIEHVGKAFVEARELYEHLSEFAHPNFAGMLGAYQEPDEQERTTIFLDPWKERTAALPTALAGIAIALTLVNHTLDEFKKHLPNFIRLCEEGIYRGGTWPADIPYRWGH